MYYTLGIRDKGERFLCASVAKRQGFEIRGSTGAPLPEKDQGGRKKKSSWEKKKSYLEIKLKWYETKNDFF